VGGGQTVHRERDSGAVSNDKNELGLLLLIHILCTNIFCFLLFYVYSITNKSVKLIPRSLIICHAFNVGIITIIII
jgi:hypothetical protein